MVQYIYTLKGQSAIGLRIKDVWQWQGKLPVNRKKPWAEAIFAFNVCHPNTEW